MSFKCSFLIFATLIIEFIPDFLNVEIKNGSQENYSCFFLLMCVWVIIEKRNGPKMIFSLIFPFMRSVFSIFIIRLWFFLFTWNFNIGLSKKIIGWDPYLVLANDFCIGVKEGEVDNLNFQIVAHTREVKVEAVVNGLLWILVRRAWIFLYAFPDLICFMLPVCIKSSILWNYRLFSLVVQCKNNAWPHISQICRIVDEICLDGWNVDAAFKFMQVIDLKFDHSSHLLSNQLASVIQFDHFDFYLMLRVWQNNERTYHKFWVSDLRF